MVGESEQVPQATSRRRTEGDRERRRDLADVAAGIPPATESEVGKFRVVIYLCGALNADLKSSRDSCKAYADSLSWDVVAVIEDRDGLLPPDGRSGLNLAIERIKAREAGALLTPWQMMISSIPSEFHEVSREIEGLGGFVQVMAVDYGRSESS
ncbi:hypothetical protein IAG44_35800 [Streptomyces roseirectus]|uniref:Resolvase/invertase-type recombinase catalytic domain-containing protein n=1 Tax=Streptomyces roseirectus TaxID=2768066 RepID=A0A7H0INC9_9ACTN|nr:hypothetical protein [Streptomyces roseirectus]QNP74295.1 hypothetical protein IAG44_35800 [Streptomyces roseirectus]